ncbi:N-acetylmuramoyl-L-alanine amidase [Corynebacterium propinquum]|uniref:N-acetylmuramoyl-L-alanine amidase n=1 Tax=Corynebacterium propinquum TaxID=43769 RepID=UPI0025437F7C|nr:N-acetylmuramoyl-L-alanine amidase [Corynebacterium propinquum]MDK4252610.1 N-acetylmuramoyl-L-alanine amidase [Corynebacterium propinquum]WKS49453.1 N-acetylmuramoyl-L-alanine amidase [Corynebacterium propinquum]
MPPQFSADITRLTDVDAGWRDPHKVPQICLHTYECPRESGIRALINRADWQRTSRTGSYTILVSADGKTLRANDDDYSPAAALHTANVNGFHLSFLAYASSSRAEWLKYDAQLRAAARVVADWCRRYGHEPRHLSVAEVRGRKIKGICTHADVSAAYRESDHTDPGKNFPMDVFIAMVTEELHGKPQGEKMSDKAFNLMVDNDMPGALNTAKHSAIEARDQLAGPGGPGKFTGWPQLGNRTVVNALAAIGHKLGVDGFQIKE